MAKLIIYSKGNVLVNGLVRGEFTWMPEYGTHVFKNKVLDEVEFNEVIERVLRTYTKFFPLVKVVEFSKPAAAAPEPIAETIPEEMSLSDALDVVGRLAPHRLKKQPGPQPALAGT